MDTRRLIFFRIIVVLVPLGLAVASWLWWRSLAEPAAPHIDLQLVQIATEVPPFYDGIFREDDRVSEEAFLRDPYLLRARPLTPDLLGIGPHDVLGFRNLAVPIVADVITIGDSHTYGTGSLIEEIWPSRIRAGAQHISVYNMAVGGWGPIEYLGIFDKALFFEPQTVILAFYSGNDPLNAVVRGRSPHWIERVETLVPEIDLRALEVPRVQFPPPANTLWKVKLSDRDTTFTPQLREISSAESPVADAGWALMTAIARDLVARANSAGIRLLVTVIPTKELTFEPRLRAEGVDLRDDYRRLVTAERARIDIFTTDLRRAGIDYVDVLQPLQNAVSMSSAPYPESTDGHPTASGHQVIANALLPSVVSATQATPQGIAKVSSEFAGRRRVSWVLIRGDRLWRFEDRSHARKLGWPVATAVELDSKITLDLELAGTVGRDPAIWGPEGNGAG